MKNYDPKDVVITVDGSFLTGYADGTFVTTEKTEDSFTTVVGADGTVSRAESANTLGTITVTLKNTSPSNPMLTGLANSKAIFPVNVTDANKATKMLAGGSQAWLQKPGPQSRGGTIEDTVWTFTVADYTQE